jgi:hypothetical protein
MSLRLVHVEFDTANAFVRRHHRHSDEETGHRFSIGCWDERKSMLVGVAIVGRPKARGWDKNRVVEVTRVCTDGTKNACSILYGASARAAAAMGYELAITYTLTRELGASLRAAGWSEAHDVKARRWSCDSRPRRSRRDEEEDKRCWVKELAAAGPSPEDESLPLLELAGLGR